MTKDELIARRQKAEKQFEDKTQEANDIQVELNRLQGDYRILTELIDGYVEPKVEEKK